MIHVEAISEPQSAEWDSYVGGHRSSTAYHQYGFRTLWEDTYRHSSSYLVARQGGSGKVTGVLPLFVVRSLLFGTSVVSLPFCDYGGVLADDQESEQLLVTRAKDVLEHSHGAFVELRQTEPLAEGTLAEGLPAAKDSVLKCRLRLELCESGASLFNGLDSKLRSQIRRPQKEGCTVSTGGLGLLDDFYGVFVRNMRDLGSPVHAKEVVRRLLVQHPAQCQLHVVHRDKQPIAAACTIGYKDTLYNPWASSDRRFQRIAPNMLLYWGMLEHAIAGGYRVFDFGRSTEGEGSFRFKKQWGARSEPLHWYRWSAQGNVSSIESDGRRRRLFVMVWRRLPLWLTRLLGPRIRRGISL